MVSSRTIRTDKPFWLCWMVIFEALVGCHDILILVKSLIKWRQRPDMTLAVDWDVKHQFKQNKASPFLFKHQLYYECVCRLLHAKPTVYGCISFMKIRPRILMFVRLFFSLLSVVKWKTKYERPSVTTCKTNYEYQST